MTKTYSDDSLFQDKADDGLIHKVEGENPESPLFRIYSEDQGASAFLDRDSPDPPPTAWGVQFPGGRTYVLWNGEVFGDDRLRYDHISMYGSVSDFLQVAQGVIVWGSWT